MITQADYVKMLARQAPKQRVKAKGVERESDLHADIADYCKSNGWLAIHGRMDERSSISIGAPDFIILRDAFPPNGATGIGHPLILPDFLLVECKTRLGKLSPKQQAFHAWAAKLGHTVHICRSLDDFKAL